MARGKKVVHIDLKRDQPKPGALASLMLGPTGNLRAPALRKGKSLVIGFEEGLYGEVLGI